MNFAALDTLLDPQLARLVEWNKSWVKKPCVSTALLENGSSTLLPEKEDSTNVVVFREPGEPQVGTYEYLTSSKDTILNWDATGSIAG